MSTKQNPVRVLIIDDHPIVRQGITQLINQQKDLTVCGEAGDVRNALDSIEKCKPDIVILDLSLNGASGIELLKDIKIRYPRTPILILSMHDEGIYAPRALRAGASGYIMKQEGPEKVVAGIRKILNGEVYLSEKLGAKLLSQMAGGRSTIAASPVEQLSDRELEIFTLIGQGYATRAISEKLHLSVKTIESHRAHIKEKLNLKNASELVHHAIQWAQSETFGAKPPGSPVGVS
jgi:DNA-binding NarL/FixJ family response regulator